MNTSGAVRCKPLGVFCCVFGIFVVYFAFFHNSSQPKPVQKVSLRHILAVAAEAAILGGHEVRQVRLQADLDQKSKGKTLEGVNDPVTAGDLRSHRAMYSALTASLPGVGVISEEHDVGDYGRKKLSRFSLMEEILSVIGRDEELEAGELVVWIDPLDATKEYTENLLQYVTTMVCVAQKGRPIAGVIHRPFKNETYWAWVGKGHSKNLQSRHDTPADPLRVVVSISHKGDVESYLTKKLGQNAATVYSAAGAGYKVLDVVSSSADAYVHTTRIKKWDTCAGNAILSALGGSMTTLKGRRVIDYSSRVEHVIDDGLLATFFPEKFSKLD